MKPLTIDRGSSRQIEIANDKEYIELYVKNLMSIVEEDVLLKDD